MKKLSLIVLVAIGLCACDKPINQFELHCSTWYLNGDNRDYGNMIAKNITAITYKNHAVLVVDGQKIKLPLDKETSDSVNMHVYTAPIPKSNESYVFRFYEQDDGQPYVFVGFESQPEDGIYNTRYANCKIIEQ